MTLEVLEVSGQIHAPAVLLPEKNRWHQLVDPRAGLLSIEKNSFEASASS
jgi:hypothetical protein